MRICFLNTYHWVTVKKKKKKKQKWIDYQSKRLVRVFSLNVVNEKILSWKSILTHQNLSVRFVDVEVKQLLKHFWYSIVVRKIRYTRKRHTARKQQFYEHLKVPASGRPRRVFLRHNWLSRIPAWNAHEDERYKMLRRWLPRQMEKARSKHLRRAYNYTPVCISPRCSSTLNGLRLC